MSGEAHGVVLGQGEGETLGNPLGGTVTFKARTRETGGSLMVAETSVPVGQGPPLHVHAHEDEFIYVLEGDVLFRMEEDTRAASTGAFVYIPRGLRHTWRNIGDRPARLLIGFTPSGMERFFERMAEQEPQAGDPRAIAAAFAAAGRGVGLDVVGPPLAAE
jgi:quercetin dioxygenase-like cupin family protein